MELNLQTTYFISGETADFSDAFLVVYFTLDLSLIFLPMGQESVEEIDLNSF